MLATTAAVDDSVYVCEFCVQFLQLEVAPRQSGN